MVRACNENGKWKTTNNIAKQTGEETEEDQQKHGWGTILLVAGVTGSLVPILNLISAELGFSLDLD